MWQSLEGLIIVCCYLRWTVADATAEANADPYYQTFGYGNTGYADRNIYYAPRYPAYPSYGYSSSPIPIYGSPSGYPAAYGHFLRNPAPGPAPLISVPSGVPAEHIVNQAVPAHAHINTNINAAPPGSPHSIAAVADVS